jgi:peptide/nickel transport system substrate-binding protein
MRKWIGLVCVAMLASAPLGARAASVLNVGLAGDPSALDPATSGNFLDRNVFASLCDKLIDTDADMHFIPMLATSWEWSADGLALTLHLRPGVRFQDGTELDASAVQVNILRDKAFPGSVRKGELGAVSSVEVVDPLTVRLHLSAPSAPLLAVLADRAGIVMSPAAIAREGANIGQHPVCAGPYSFTERVAQDHITLDRFPGYWNAAAIHIDRIVYRPIPDSSVRLVNLQSGALQIIDQLAPTDVAAVRGNPRLAMAQHTAAAYRMLEFNLHHGPRADTPLMHDPRIRLALEKSIDRNVINQVVFNGMFVPNNQTEVPHSLYWDPARPVPGRDLAGARALLAQAGVPHPAFTLQLANNPIDGQVGQVIQSMAGEAGFRVKLEQSDAAAGNQEDMAGAFDVALLTWSGRADPDANLSIFLTCKGPFNYGQYCSPAMDSLLAKARAITDPAARVPLYRQVVALDQTDLPQIILYNYTWLWGMSARLSGFVPNQDGLIRPQGLVLKP